MDQHNHTIAEVYRLQEELNNRAPKNHEHPEYSPKGHKHDEYAEKVHRHDEYAAKEHEHKGYAPANHTHSGFAAEKHKHDEYAPVQHSHGEYAPKDHTHEGFAPERHKHEEYALKEHEHKGYAAKDHTHSGFAPLKHSHTEYAKADHEHPELVQAIKEASVGTARLYSGESLDVDSFGKTLQVFCTNTAARPVHIRDYFVSKHPNRFNCQNIVIPSGKQFAVRIYRTDSANLILFDGMMSE